MFVMKRLALLLIFTSGLFGALSADELAKRGAVKDSSLRLELLALAQKDQEIRHERTKYGTTESAKSLSKSQQKAHRLLTEKMMRIDAANTKRLTQIVEKHGWPTFALVGKDGAAAAWLLVQHADASPKFQRRCLDLMSKLPPEQVSQSNVAYLTDRVLLAEGKKQVYGTQMMEEGDAYKPRPLEDAEGVDKRRAAVGLPPLAEYLKEVEEFYRGEGGR